MDIARYAYMRCFFGSGLRVSGSGFRVYVGIVGAGAGPYFLSLGLGFPDSPLQSQKGTLLIPRVLLDLDDVLPSTMLLCGSTQDINPGSNGRRL